MDKIKASQFADLAYYCRFVPPSRTITFAAPASTLTNFPALVKSNSTFNIGTSTGYDVHFQDLGGNELAYELDFYDSVTGNGAWWVKIPSLASSGTTSIKMLYGDSSASTDGSSPLTVWADYAAVYHLNELDYAYQTNRSTGTQSSAPFAQSGTMSFQMAGVTGRALRFASAGGVDDITKCIITTGISLSSENYSVMAIWDRLSDYNNIRRFCVFSPQMNMGAWSPTAYDNYNGNNTLANYNPQNLSALSGRYPNYGNKAVTLSSFGPNLVGCSFARGIYRYSQVNDQIGSGNSGEYSTTYYWSNFNTWYSLVSGYQSAGAVSEFDELRFCKSPHTQDWMAYEYSNYIDHANNVTYGPEA